MTPERLIGETLGRYRVEALVGSGGFAWVFRAFDPELEIPVALKVLKPQYAGDGDFEARFRREASTAAKLRHPNIVKIFAVGKASDAVYFAMDYLPRGLADRLDAAQLLPEATVLRAGTDVARALAFAHREGVVHRDIKVDNILFDDHGNAVVADFGIARAVAEEVRRTATNMVVGTPQYFSPEQARGHELDGRSDIYSLGVTLYRAAVGRLPFEGEDWYLIARQHIEEPPPPPRELVPAISPEFEAVILRCLAKKPDDRYPDAAELAEDLEAIRHRTLEITAARTIVIPAITDEPAPVGRRTPTPRAATPATGEPIRAPTRGRAVAVGVVAAAVAVAGAMALRGRAPSETHAAPAPETAAGTAETAATAGTPPDTAGLDSGTKGMVATTDSIQRSVTTPPVKQSLTVTAPPDAEVLVNGRPVRMTNGRWANDRLAAGNYQVVAQLPSAAQGCPTAREQQTLRIPTGGRRQITLSPRACGRLELILRRVPPGTVATYTLRSEGQPAMSGRVEGRGVVALPVGVWNLHLQAPQCGPWDDTVHVSERPRPPLTLSLICGPE